jgi:polar amino acid transport system substrate-binding protein
MLLSIVRTPERERNLHFAGAIFTTRVTAFATQGPDGRVAQAKCRLAQAARGAQRSSIFVSLPREQATTCRTKPTPPKPPPRCCSIAA